MNSPPEQAAIEKAGTLASAAIADRSSDEEWTLVIRPRESLFSLRLAEVWRYRDLLMLFVRRDFVAFYKQTILGPIWYILQPLMMTVVFTLIFSKIAGISTDDTPPILFYLGGITLWAYFSESLTKIADTFFTNQQLFGKVYFPRIIVPMSVVVSGLIKLAIQFSLFIAMILFFIWYRDVPLRINAYALLFPVLVLILAMLSMGFGMIISALTSKYRDLKFALTFGIQLWMYASPVVYPMSIIGGGKWRYLILANPISPILECFKLGFLGDGTFYWGHLGYSGGFAVVLMLTAIVIFNRVERTFMDTV
ncbi:MAG: ABC transporter permease [Planctomycetota bacterium]